MSPKVVNNGLSGYLFTLAWELAPISGHVEFLGQPTASPMYKRCPEGLGCITEGRSVIMSLTLAENLRLAGVSVPAALELFPSLEPLLRRKAGLWSGGEQQMLTLARSLGRQPDVLLADEHSLGLAPRRSRSLIVCTSCNGAEASSRARPRRSGVGNPNSRLPIYQVSAD